MHFMSLCALEGFPKNQGSLAKFCVEIWKKTIKNPFVKVETSSMMSCLCPLLASLLADKVLSLTISSLLGFQPSQRKNPDSLENPMRRVGIFLGFSICAASRRLF